MSVRIVIDMNLSPTWSDLLQANGWSAVHWSAIGDARATDREIMDWAVANGHVVFTHDLDFGTALALTHATGPSVLQVRGQDVLPDHMGDLVMLALRQHEAILAAGALAVVDERRSRVRILPLSTPVTRITSNPLSRHTESTRSPDLRASHNGLNISTHDAGSFTMPTFDP